MKSKKAKYILELDEELVADLRLIAQAEGCSLPQYIELIFLKEVNCRLVAKRRTSNKK